MVGAGPVRQDHRWMKEVLDAVYGNRFLFAGDIENALDAQEIGPLGRCQHLDPADELIPVERRRMREAEGTDVIIMAVHIMRMLAMMPVMVVPMVMPVI